jgi:F-type H+-transporting ATPase subunit gamma
MAGPYNVNVFKKVNELVKPTDKVIVFGIKGEKLFKAKNTNFLRHFEIYEKDLLFFSFRYAATYIKKLFNTGKFNSIEYIYTTHTTSLNVKNVQILPFPNKTKTTSSPFLFEPNQDAILDNTLKFYIESTLYSAFLESKLCEQISRKTSMSHANDNISDMLSQLSITYNKKRQEKITQEVTH